MKKLFFGLILFFGLMNSVNAQTEKAQWPYGCRKWTIGINVGIFSMTSEVTLCCVAANWKNPPISCTEMDRKSIASGNVYQYVMVDELETKMGKKIETSEIEVYSENPYFDEGVKYLLKKDFYKIELNERKERFIKVLFEKIN